jgi:predicted nucleotidyltransferase
MDIDKLKLPDNYQFVMKRFLAACQADDRILAAFLGGSYVENKADEFSDLDLYFITTDESYDDFITEREYFVHLLGEPIFLEDFGALNGYFVIFSNGADVEFWFSDQNNFRDIHEGPYTVLLDKSDLLVGEVFPLHVADQVMQVEILRQQINWFWHELSHFIKAISRQQLWFAYGELEVMRKICVNLARLSYNFSDAYVGDEPYFKVDDILPVEQLVPLQSTYCPMVREPMVKAAQVICHFYQDLAPSLAESYKLTYQNDLEQMMLNQLKRLSDQD